MALDKVFVSPGVYTSERDLSFVTSNVGVTTLGLVGEVTKGPAFKPVFVSNYNEFKTFFGGLNPKKVKDSGSLQYELPYIAKSYLTNSNQLYVTRVLGLSGYDAGEAYELKVTVDAVDTVVAVLRSRASYNGDEELTFNVGTVTLGIGSTLDSLEITVDGTPINVSLDKTKKNYITRVLGRTAQDGKSPLYVEEIRSNFISTLELTDPVTITTVVDTDAGDYKKEYNNAVTPYIVSEVKGAGVDRLFRFHTISDGEAANEQIKVSIVNIKPDEREFDVIVRSFNDTDANPVQLERFSGCSMDPASSNFISRKIGDVEGDYISLSSYILVEIAVGEDSIADSFPSGFEGYPVRVKADNANPVYKTAYSEFENKRRVYLGVSESFDNDLLKFKGLPDDGTAELTDGFHMDVNANTLGFVTGTETFSSEVDASTGTYEKLYARTFTVLPYGGFDGWDVYRTSRTTGDNYTVQKIKAKEADTATYPNFVNVFTDLPLTDGDAGINSDYYAFLEAARKFSNPEAVNVNVFATPGIDMLNNGSLVEYVIDMVERERSDSLYVVTLPDTNSDGSIKTPQEVADDIYGKFDSNYTTTYWPWVQIKDTENNVLVYVPPTTDVMRNIALTDNVSYPWFATAGFQRGDVKATKARIKLTQQDRDVLYDARINPIATFSGDGIKIFGNKNLQIKESSLNRVNVRRLLLQTRKLISAVAVRLLFDQNDDTLRNDFLRQVNPILENIRKERGLTDFKVQLVASPEDKDRNTLSGKIRIKPTNALEFIDLQFDVMSTGASFEDL